MSIKKIITIALPLLGLSLVSCQPAQNNDNFRLFYNHYDTYTEMAEHIDILNENIPENEQFVFDFNINDFSTDYIVAGVDLCVSKGVIKTLEEHDKNRCNYLYTREIFYQLKKDNILATIIFKDKIDFDEADLYWTQEKLSFQGTILNYEQNANGSKYYLRYEENDIIVLKFNINSVGNDIVELFQNSIRHFIKGAI